MKFISGIVLGIALSAGMTLSLLKTSAPCTLGSPLPSPPSGMPALTWLKRSTISAATKAAAIRASDEAIRQLNLALAYRGKEDRK